MSSENKTILDGFQNIIKGLETDKDARIHTTFRSGLRIDQNLANNLYTYNWICGKAVDAPVEDAIQNWRSLLISDPEKKKEVERAMKAVKLKGAVENGLKWARVFGGSAIIPIIDGQDLADELDVTAIRRDSLRNLIVLDRWNIYPDSIDRDILSDNFGKPEFYTVSRSGQLVHYSRVIRFDGLKTTLYELEKENYWGLSLFSRLWEPISDSQTVSQSISNLILESNVDVYGIKGLNNLVATNDDDVVKARLRLAHEMKSIINALALDADDTYDKKTNNFTNLADLDDRFVYKVAGAIPMPVTRLIGREPAGLNATGVSDEKIYQKSLQGIQDNQIRPVLDALDPIILMSAFGSLEEFEYVFNPIQLPTEAEQADIDLKRMQRDTGYLGEGVLLESDVKAELAENGTYVTMTPERVEADLNAEEELFPEEEETEEIEEPVEEIEETEEDG